MIVHFTVEAFSHLDEEAPTPYNRARANLEREIECFLCACQQPPFTHPKVGGGGSTKTACKKHYCVARTKKTHTLYEERELTPNEPPSRPSDDAFLWLEMGSEDPRSTHIQRLRLVQLQPRPPPFSESESLRRREDRALRHRRFSLASASLSPALGPE